MVRAMFTFIIHPYDPTGVICYLIWQGFYGRGSNMYLTAANQRSLRGYGLLSCRRGSPPACQSSDVQRGLSCCETLGDASFCLVSQADQSF